MDKKKVWIIIWILIIGLVIFFGFKNQTDIPQPSPATNLQPIEVIEPVAPAPVTKPTVEIKQGSNSIEINFGGK